MTFECLSVEQWITTLQTSLFIQSHSIFARRATCLQHAIRLRLPWNSKRGPFFFVAQGGGTLRLHRLFKSWNKWHRSSNYCWIVSCEFISIIWPKLSRNSCNWISSLISWDPSFPSLFVERESLNQRNDLIYSSDRTVRHRPRETLLIGPTPCAMFRLWPIPSSDAFTAFLRTGSTDADHQRDGYERIETKLDRTVPSGKAPERTSRLKVFFVSP